MDSSVTEFDTQLAAARAKGTPHVIDFLIQRVRRGHVGMHELRAESLRILEGMAATAVLIEERLSKIEERQGGAIQGLRELSAEIHNLMGLRSAVETALTMVRSLEQQRHDYARIRAERDRERDEKYDLRFKQMEEKVYSAVNGVLAISEQMGALVRDHAKIQQQYQAESSARKEMDSAHDVAITQVRSDVALVKKDVKLTKVQVAKTVGKTGLGALGVVQLLEFLVKAWPEISKIFH